MSHDVITTTPWAAATGSAPPEPAMAAPLRLATLAGTGSSAALVAACGGGGGGEAATMVEPALAVAKALAVTIPLPAGPTLPLGPPLAKPTAAEAARFLAQASFAATDAEISRVQSMGYSAWLDDQFRAPRTQGHHDWLVERGYVVPANIVNYNGIENTLWRKLISSPDLLRQRVAFALSEIFVVSLNGLQSYWRGPMATHYADLLESHAFGTYRELLEAVTLSPCMGFYLNMRGNQKADATSGREPDENYAREILQLFSIGLVELDTHGRPRNEVVTDSYDQDTITNLAKVFTGWDYDLADKSDPSYMTRPMVLDARKHDSGPKTFFNTTVAAGTSGQAALKQALDAIANHPNVGPFIGRQLIQRLVTSQPRRAHVRRVAEVFNDNGFGQRGDLKAVIKAVLLDPEARRAPAPEDVTRGRLRPPVQRFIQWARTFKLRSPNGRWDIGDLSDQAQRLGQSPYRAPSVFNFYRPGYVPPNSRLGNRGITAPEFQINNETTMVAWANYAQTFIVHGVRDNVPDYSAELALADDPHALVRRVALLLAADSLSTTTLDIITQEVANIAANSSGGKLNRVHASIHLVLCAPEYLVQI